MFAAQVDFTYAGDLKVFVDEERIQQLEAHMQEQGYLEASRMANTFNMLRSNDLIWPYVVNNYMRGKKPFPFDILYWNSDATRMPAANHSFYLRNCYLHNRLTKGEMEIAGVKLEKKHVAGALGVRGRNSDNTLVKKVLGWEPKVKFAELADLMMRADLALVGVYMFTAGIHDAARAIAELAPGTHHIAGRSTSFPELVAALGLPTVGDWAERARALIADPDVGMAYLSLARLHGASARTRPFDLFLATGMDFDSPPPPPFDVAALLQGLA